MENPFRSRPSMALTVTTLLVVLVGAILPFTSLGGVIGFTPMPAAYFVFLIAATSTYLMLVELAKRRLMRRVLV
jgi:Mg2+-importing ATPase